VQPPCCLSSCRFEDLGGLEAEHRVSSVGGEYFWRSTGEDYMSDFVLAADVAKPSSDGGDGDVLECGVALRCHLGCMRGDRMQMSISTSSGWCF
jgi:hypothetical protein